MSDWFDSVHLINNGIGGVVLKLRVYLFKTENITVWVKDGNEWRGFGVDFILKIIQVIIQASNSENMKHMNWLHWFSKL